MARDIKNKITKTAPLTMMGVVIIGLAGCSDIEFISHATKKSNQYAGNETTPYVVDHTVSNSTETELATRYGYRVGKPYTVKGQRIVPAENFNYSQVGMASWYGGKFHGRKTANGEVFNQNALTAAHPTLPMPSIVRVTNLENGRSIRLRVNDRGPFSKDRIIDVSKAAADSLGFTGKGVARVRVDILPAESKALKQAAQFGKAKPTPAAQAHAAPAIQQHQQMPVYTPARPSSPSLGYGYQPSAPVANPAPVLAQAPITRTPVRQAPIVATPIQAQQPRQWSQQAQPNYAEQSPIASGSPLPHSAQTSQPNIVFLNPNDQQLSPAQIQEPVIVPPVADMAQPIQPAPIQPTIVAPVQAAAPTQANNPANNPIAYGRHVVQVGAFASRENAQRLQNNLSPYGQFDISQIMWGDKSLYRVRSQMINSRAAAEQLAQQLATTGLGSPQVITE